ncbi:MAG: rod shape-determining protein MreC [Candidatus Nealsonbacteria bacterium]|nr:rod shape-determining protein MreC [Candidatus Nealsonbacteria bacterium]
MNKHYLEIKILPLVIFVLAIFFLNLFQNGVKGDIYLVSSPLQRAFWRAGEKTSDFLSLFAKSQVLREENERQRIQLLEIIKKNAFLKGLEAENKSLREALRVGLADNFDLIFGSSYGKDLTEDSIIIDKGAKDGIEKGFPVVTEQKVLIGKVGEVYKNYSNVILVSNKKSVLVAYIAGKSTSGLLKGQGNFNAILTLIPKDAVLNEGDSVVSGDLVLGQVNRVINNDVKPFLEAEVSLLFKTRDLDRIFIIKKPQ